jgi:hypothetical protein
MPGSGCGSWFGSVLWIRKDLARIRLFRSVRIWILRSKPCQPSNWKIIYSKVCVKGTAPRLLKHFKNFLKEYLRFVGNQRRIGPKI